VRGRLVLEPLGLGLVEPGNDLASLLAEAWKRHTEPPSSGDVLVVAQKVVSKVEGRYVTLSEVTPGKEAIALGGEVEKDPRLVEVILSESRRVVRRRPGVLVVEHKLGFVMANAGVDRSNISHDGGERVLLLPRDPDGSAAALRQRLRELLGSAPAVIVSDSFGRPWRRGTVGVAIGAAGLPALRDWRGHRDLFGRELQVTETGFADEIASAASLLMGQADEAVPAVIVRGLSWKQADAPAATLIRPAEQDLFR
jgi:coenzyme F420-0:L-glutamate ligase/coenzyme F420-1:gamma-L-glutamate ligase